MVSKDGLIYYLQKEDSKKNLVVYDLSSNNFQHIQINDEIEINKHNRIFLNVDKDILYIYEQNHIIKFSFDLDYL